MKKRPFAHSRCIPILVVFLIVGSFLLGIKVAAAAQVQGPCHKTAPGKYDCTDQETLSRLEARDKSMQSITVYTTAYSRTSSCHNPRGKECLTAIGRDTTEGVTVACPRSLRLGTMIVVNNKWYRCEDRYAKYLDRKRGLSTIDIFFESHQTAVKYGMKKTVIQVPIN